MVLNFDFAANASVEDIAKMPTEVHAYYEKGADGKYTWAAAHRPLIESYVGMSTAAKAARTERDTFKTEAGKHSSVVAAVTAYATELGLDLKDKDVAEVIKAHVSELVSNSKKGKDSLVDFETRKAALEKGFNEKLAAKDAETGKMRGSLEKYLIDQAATAELAASKGNVKLLLPHIKSRVKVVAEGDDFSVRVLDDAGQVRYNGAAQPFTVGDLVKEMKASTDFAAAFESEAKGGTGAKPGAAAGAKPALGKKPGDMTSVDKISAGLAKRGVNR